MPVKTKADHDKQLTINTSFQEGMEVFKKFYENPTQNVLWDFRKASLARISSEQIQAILDYIKPHAGKRIGGKTAVLVSKDFEYGMSRMIQTFTEVKNIPIN
ncbi:hypothetical protein ACFL6B_04410 [Thermodesulfobacteriota bacterium]